MELHRRERVENHVSPSGSAPKVQAWSGVRRDQSSRQAFGCEDTNASKGRTPALSASVRMSAIRDHWDRSPPSRAPALLTQRCASRPLGESWEPGLLDSEDSAGGFTGHRAVGFPRCEIEGTNSEHGGRPIGSGRLHSNTATQAPKQEDPKKRRLPPPPDGTPGGGAPSRVHAVRRGRLMLLPAGIVPVGRR